jgi:ADP-heptose:LPS heptosyltransferase
MNLLDCGPDLQTFADTAALIDALDLVITVDTAVAHLAAAMGKQVWVLLPFVPDWRWMLNRNDSPWYPSMTLFRQPQIGDWKTPIDQAAAALRRLVAGA